MIDQFERWSGIYDQVYADVLEDFSVFNRTDIVKYRVSPYSCRGPPSNHRYQSQNVFEKVPQIVVFLKK